MLYKVIVFWIGSIVFFLWGLLACRVNRRFVYILFAAMIFSLTLPNSLSITFFPHPEYKMATRGLEIHLADICALTLFFHIIAVTPRHLLYIIPPLTTPQLLLITTAILSWFFVPPAVANPLAAMQSSLKQGTLLHTYSMETILHLNLYPLFEIAKLFRGFLIFWVCVNLSRDRNIIRTIYVAFSILLLYFALKSLTLRYFYGVHRVSAGIGHYNNFNTFIGLMGAFLIPLAFSTKRTVTSLFVWSLLLCASISIILTISRSALFAFILVLLLSTPLLLIKYLSFRNTLFLFLGALFGVAMLLKAQHTLMQRFVYNNPTESAFEEREALKNEARLMAKDYTLGVGMGNFSAWSILRYSHLTRAELGNFAHNSFFLTLGEMGYPGLIIFWIFWLRYIYIGSLGLIYHLLSSDHFGLSAMLGANLSILFMMPQLWFQFTYRATPIYLLVHILLGIGVGQYLLACRQKR